METSAASSALQLLFKKLHPHLEDAAHAVRNGASSHELEKLHSKLLRTREQVVGSLETMGDGCDDEELSEILIELSDNLSPVGEAFQQSLILTQLCLEQAVEDLMPFIAAERFPETPEPGPSRLELADKILATDPELSWMKRVHRFLEQLRDPAFSAENRWDGVDPDIGEEDFD